MVLVQMFIDACGTDTDFYATALKIFCSTEWGLHHKGRFQALPKILTTNIKRTSLL
jgi:hypothetical protein